MHGVDKITVVDDVMMISYTDATALFMVKTLNKLADAGVVIDMICQTAPYGGGISFAFTSAISNLDVALKALGRTKEDALPMLTSGYTKINLYGEQMVQSVGVAAKAMAALQAEGIEISMITTSDLDISILLRREDGDVALQLLRNTFVL